MSLSSRSGSIDITPESSVSLGAGGGPSRVIDSRLEFNYIVLEDQQGESVGLCSIDSLYTTKDLDHAVAEILGIDAKRLLVGASHTHNAPMLDDTKPGLGVADRTYVEHLQHLLRHQLLRAAPQRTVDLHGAQGMANHSINRRLKKRLVISKRPRLSSFVNAPNPSGSRDELVTLVLAVEAGKPRWVIWSYACHPVAHPIKQAMSAHYPGVVRDALRHALGQPDLPVVFFQGFSGDTRPCASAKVNGLERRIRRILTGRLFSDMTVADYRSWTRSLADHVCALISGLEPLKVEKPVVRSVIIPISEMVDSKQNIPDCTVSLVNLGDLSILGVGAEVVSGYGELVRSALRAKVSITAGCVGQTFGYLPTREILEEGGYEAGGYGRKFAINCVRARAPESFQDAVDSLVREPN